MTGPAISPPPLHYLTSLDPGLAAFIDALPKTEVHLHLDGALNQALLRSIDPVRYAGVPPFWAPDFRYDSFLHFLEIVHADASPWLTTPDRYFLTAQAMLAECAAQNVRYVETSVHLANVEHAGPLPEIFDAIRAAAKGFPAMAVRIFMGVCRDDYPRFGPKIEKAITLENLDGIDLHGIETIALQEWTPGVWQRARANGKFTKAHAGEFGPAAFVSEAVERLGVTRIEHGVRAVEDPQVVQLLRERDVTLDISPLSNLKLRVTPSISEHPIGRLHRAGVRCTVNSDDPYFFGTTLREEYAVLALEAGFSRRDLAVLARNGFEIALISPEEKASWLAEIDQLLENLP